MTDIEDRLVASSTGPRITPKMIDDAIVAINYINAGDAIAILEQPTHPSQHLLTICVLVLKNGFTVTGESACASPENFNEAIGQEIALANAKQKIWPLMGYALRDHLTYGGQSFFAQPAS